MKKILSVFAFAAAILAAVPSCTKDDNNGGATIALSFPMATTAETTAALQPRSPLHSAAATMR